MNNKSVNRSTARRCASASRGFTLVEVLLALGVFAIGMIAVASLFPVAAILQRETTQEVIGQNAAASAEAVINARQLTFAPPSSSDIGLLDNYHSIAGPTYSNAVPLHAINANLLTQWLPAADRSYPTAQVIRTPSLDISNCELYWVPFVQDLSGTPTGTSQTWVMRLFLLEADSRANYLAQGNANPNDPNTFPRVVSTGCTVQGDNGLRLAIATHGLQSGDVVMDSNGNEHRITEVNGRDLTVLTKIPTIPTSPTVLWYAPPYGASNSPARRILTVSIDVAAP